MINGEERVIFDPAGTFSSDLAPEQHDVLFGITPQVAAQYTAYHTRADFDSHLLVQSIDISAEMANALLRAAKAHGEVPGGLCARSTSSLIASLPGFENIQQTWFPLKVSEQFGAIAGVTTRRIN
ncbi:hypothetical protein L0664_01245 [Octadecabacter sp. G9-8]|uniref:Uncharacterized protein n=1 Tax=Octadecabacter dasysiphoniae TaxID=2909341 RepID=A0ABS9CR13_9RHOB|nr:hypothetical protein [Octadecabacter dasysiphoniae]MCF2869678.1 hypothetical protein [Octadecabacter dasysiphoniae]